ncbi:helix-turn-helix transcriptional regulator [Pseudomonas sp. Gutcm_11s]|uniref:helix-turn-helix transcriptional regulator n=1 Tax=Pseudomonas sp. Gutcm_11s TaxID=3026088 RepID=UPI00235DD13F|nr:AlpA family phage regulatory protein [Pseudomonas sp. Gutcm_11s]MDD0843368.1 AlpA family phage regulatory protein [Pseudomonas sp. Gutcm_11s]
MTLSPLDSLIKLSEVMRQVGIGKTKIYKLIQDDLFPTPVKLGSVSRWSQLEIQDWIEQQKAARDRG